MCGRVTWSFPMSCCTFLLLLLLHMGVQVAQLASAKASPDNTFNDLDKAFEKSEGRLDEMQSDIPHQEVENWAAKFGHQLYAVGRLETHVEHIVEAFKNKGAKVEKDNLTELLNRMANDIEKMLYWKVQAVKRITDTVEQVMQGRAFDPDLKYDYTSAKKVCNISDYDLGIFPACQIPLLLTPNSHFDNIPVNTSTSSVHVPVSVFDQAPDVINQIKTTENLNVIFQSNYGQDPSLTWQYFGSATGFLRQYPAMQWKPKNVIEDMYDCRLRPWYIEAAASPKDVLILLDISGSMTGIRKEIAKHVVLTILETLHEDDYINVLTFNDTTEELYECFKTLMPATSLNVRELRLALEDWKITEGIANMSQALTNAFQLLRTVNRSNEGCQCNQAIMLVTDAAPSTFDDIFKVYNWPDYPVRVFTYLIGKEVTETREVKWMACANKGFYTHVTTISEVREKVLEYIHVLARPLVLHQKRNVIWTSVYADSADPRMAKWLWEMREKERQKRKLILLRLGLHRSSFGASYYDEREYNVHGNVAALGSHSTDGTPAQHPSAVYDDDLTDAEMDDHMGMNMNGGDTGSTAAPSSAATPPEEPVIYRPPIPAYRLMTTVAAPVFDRRTFKTVHEKYRTSEGKVENIRDVRIANILGVAATDVPLREFTKLAPSYKLGANGYAFMITNNGHILFHPDLRVTFEDILKPYYNTVDLSDVEVRDWNPSGPFDSDPVIYALRKRMIERETGDMPVSIKTHLDDMHRVVTRTNHYHYRPINDTPFSFGIAVPETYGKYKVKGETEIRRDFKPVVPTMPSAGSSSIADKINFKIKAQAALNAAILNSTLEAANNNGTISFRQALDYFNGNKWRIHPDWVYCEYIFQNRKRPMMSPEENLLHFLQKMSHSGFNWQKIARVRHPPQTDAEYSFNYIERLDKDEFYCDRELVQSLLFDAEVTHMFTTNHTSLKYESNKSNSLKNKLFSLTTFIATRSGLTRWQDHLAQNNDQEPHFLHRHYKAIDEPWYKRTVDYCSTKEDSFVVSVPFRDRDSDGINSSYVLATHAIFLGAKDKRAPAAVVGVQFRHQDFAEFFLNVTSSCDMKICQNCSSDDLDCYLLDNNAYVVVSENRDDTGKYFGEVKETLMYSLIQDNIYKKITLVDHQAICIHELKMVNFANFLLSPVNHMMSLFKWAWMQIAFFMVQMNLYTFWSADWLISQAGGASVSITTADEMNRIIETLTKDDLQPCEETHDFYQLQADRVHSGGNKKQKTAMLASCSPQKCDSGFIVQLVPYTNLVLLVVDKKCPCDGAKLPYGVEVKTRSREVIYNVTEDYCMHLKYRSASYRKRPAQCYSQHPGEVNITECGGASSISASAWMVAVVSVSFVIYHLAREDSGRLR